MTSHSGAAAYGVNKAMKMNNASGKKMVNAAKRHANNKLKGSGNAKAILKAAARKLANHPASGKAQKMVKAVA